MKDTLYNISQLFLIGMITLTSIFGLVWYNFPQGVKLWYVMTLYIIFLNYSPSAWLNCRIIKLWYWKKLYIIFLNYSPSAWSYLTRSSVSFDIIYLGVLHCDMEWHYIIFLNYSPSAWSHLTRSSFSFDIISLGLLNCDIGRHFI